ncbi:hypothetical protein [Acetobacterium bakii]|nr:hypothetical protein [Acetobacterium bakii]
MSKDYEICVEAHPNIYTNMSSSDYFTLRVLPVHANDTGSI